jgi:hypothetical protein
MTERWRQHQPRARRAITIEIGGALVRAARSVVALSGCGMLRDAAGREGDDMFAAPVGAKVLGWARTSFPPWHATPPLSTGWLVQRDFHMQVRKIWPQPARFASLDHRINAMQSGHNASKCNHRRSKSDRERSNRCRYYVDGSGSALPESPPAVIRFFPTT